MQYQGMNGMTYSVEEQKLASGGEGAIYAVQGNPTVVAKIFREGKRTVQREQKLRIMVAKKITKKQLTYFTWPQDVLYDTEGFAGYIMPKVSGMKTLTELYSEDRYDIEWRLVAAYNVCVTVEAIHEVGQICGDLNSLNILVNLTENDPNCCHVTLVDTDSYHVVTDNMDYRCEVGMSDYLAPEIQKKMGNGVTLRNAPLPTYTMETDRFALAVHIFCLLMNGCHPFACAKQVGDSIEDTMEQKTAMGDMPSVVAPQPIDNIKEGFFPFCMSKPGIAVPAYAPDFDSLPPSLQALFRQTFCEGYDDPAKRVTASEWVNALSSLWNEGFKQCDKGHKMLAGAPVCPLCQIEKKLEGISGKIGGSPIIPPSKRLEKPISPTPIPNPNIHPLGGPAVAPYTPKPTIASNIPEKRIFGGRGWKFGLWLAVGLLLLFGFALFLELNISGSGNDNDSYYGDENRDPSYEGDDSSEIESSWQAAETMETIPTVEKQWIVKALI